MDNPEQVLAGSRTGKRHYAMVLLAALVFGALFVTGYRPWKERQNRLYAASEKRQELVVSTVKVGRAAAAAELTFPGALSATIESPIYARAEGYIKTRTVDIGDRVKAGQLLVEIDTPELDEQLRQARYRYNQFKASSGSTQAAFRQAEANLKLAETVLARTEALVKEGVFSRQELDEKQAMRDVRVAELASAKAAVEAAEEGKRAVNSDVERFLSLTAFQKVVAPFDGIITARNCEVGNLINAAALASGRELYRLADPRELRFMVNIPQPNAPAIHPGLAARLTLPEFPRQTWEGRVVRTAQTLDPASRTLLTEIRIDNRTGALLPGMYGEIRILVDRPSAPLLIPGDTPVVRAGGTFVAVVRPDRTIHYQKLAIGRDLGNQIEVIDGLRGDERIVVNPGDEIREGVKVSLADEKPAEKQ